LKQEGDIKMPRVIGMDVHRDFAQVVALENERLRQLGRVKLDKESLTSFAGRLAPDDEVVLEATGNTFAIVRVLRPKVGRVAVANPLQVRLIAHARSMPLLLPNFMQAASSLKFGYPTRKRRPYAGNSLAEASWFGIGRDSRTRYMRS
jgi:hypothetical protein